MRHPRFASARGADLWVGALTGLLATAPWLLACVGWAAHWNAYINLSFTFAGFVLWLTVYGIWIGDAVNRVRAEERDVTSGDEYPVRTFDDVRQLFDRGTEMVYVHNEYGAIIAMVIPKDGWWANQLPEEAPYEHFSHDHVYPWGEPT